MAGDLPPVKIQLVAEGIEGIKNAFKSVEEAAKRMEEAVTRTRRAGSTKRTNDTKKEESDRIRAAEQSSKKREQIQEREFAKLSRQAEKWRREEIAAEKRKNAQLEAEARKSSAARAAFFKNVGSKVVSGVGRTVSKIAGFAGAVAAIGGGFSVADAVGQSLANQKTSRQIAMQTFNNKTGKYDMTPESTYSMGKNIAASSGFDTKDSLDAIKGFGETGGYENVKKMEGAIKEIGNIAMATGADFAQLSKSAGLIFAGDTTQSADDLTKKLRMMATMGRAGAVDLGDMAGSLNRITASAAQFSGDKMKNLTTMAALTQLARTKGTASSADEATESTKSLSLDIAHNAKHFQALGINVKDKLTGELLDPRTTVMRSLAATGGDSEKLLKLYGHRSFKGIQGIQRIYQDERGKALKEGVSPEKAAQRGLDAANKALDEFTETVVDAARMNKEADEMRKDPSIRLAQEMDKLKNAIGDRLVPELVKVIPKIAELTPTIMRLLEKLINLGNWLVENPLKGAFIAVAALIAKEAAVALTASFFKSLFTGGSGAGNLAGGAGMGPVGLGLAAGASTALVIGNSMIKTEVGKEEAQDLRAKVEAWGRDPTNPNAISPQAAQKKIDEAKARLSKTNAFEQAANLATSPFVEASDKAYGRYKADQGLTGEGLWGGEDKEALALQKAIAEANKMHGANTTSTDENTKAVQNLNRTLQSLPSNNGSAGGTPFGPPPVNGQPQVAGGGHGSSSGW